MSALALNQQSLSESALFALLGIWGGGFWVMYIYIGTHVCHIPLTIESCAVPRCAEEGSQILRH